MFCHFSHAPNSLAVLASGQLREWGKMREGKEIIFMSVCVYGCVSVGVCVCVKRVHIWPMEKIDNIQYIQFMDVNSVTDALEKYYNSLMNRRLRCEQPVPWPCLTVIWG